MSARDGLLLAIDQGSHATRALLFDRQGRVCGEARRPIATRRPRPGYVEHDAGEVLRSLRESVAEVTAALDDGTPVVAAGLATQRSTIACWDARSGRPLAPALSWQDTRNRGLIQSLADQEALVRRVTGLPLSAHYGASKLRWCLDNVASVRSALENERLAWGPLASFLLYGTLAERPRLCDPANAARSLVWDLTRRDWSPRLLELFGLPRDPLPRCVATRHAFGTLRIGTASVPLTVCTGDQSAVPFLAGWPDRDTVFINAGTGAFIQRCTGARRVGDDRLLTGLVYADSGRVEYSIEGTVNGAGAALTTMAGKLQLDERRALAAVDLERADVPLFLNGVGGLGSPWWRTDFRSRWLGKGDAQGRFQAVLESVLFLLRANIEELARLSGPVHRLVLAGGFADNPRFIRGLAALAGCPVTVPADVEATARGVAFLLARDLPAPAVRETRPRPAPRLLERYERWKRAMQETA